MIYDVSFLLLDYYHVQSIGSNMYIYISFVRQVIVLHIKLFPRQIRWSKVLCGECEMVILVAVPAYDWSEASCRDEYKLQAGKNEPIEQKVRPSTTEIL